MQPFWLTKRVRQVQPYEKLAGIYDYIMRHVDYGHWANYVMDLIRRWHPHAVSILDVACGSGNLLQMLNKEQFRVGGCDCSFAMTQQAKLKKSLQGVPIWCGDMIKLAVKSPVDVLLCLYDSVNYLMDLASINQFFCSAAATLAPQGLLIFDICTERNSIEFFSNYYDHEKQPLFSYFRWSHYARKSRIQYTEFKIKFKSDPMLYWEIHQQKIYPVDPILQVIQASPLRLLEQYDGFTFQRPGAKTNRIHLVLARKD